MKMYPYLWIPTINNCSASHISIFTFVFKFFSSHIHYFYTLDRKGHGEDQVNQVVQENRTGLAVERERQQGGLKTQTVWFLFEGGYPVMVMRWTRAGDTDCFLGSGG